MRKSVSAALTGSGYLNSTIFITDYILYRFKFKSVLSEKSPALEVVITCISGGDHQRCSRSPALMLVLTTVATLVLTNRHQHCVGRTLFYKHNDRVILTLSAVISLPTSHN